MEHSGIAHVTPVPSRDATLTVTQRILPIRVESARCNPFSPKMLGIRATHRQLCLVTPRRVDSRIIGNISLRAVSAHQQRSNSSSTWHKNAQAGFSVGNELYNKYGCLIDSCSHFYSQICDRVRPTYPPESIALIREAVKATPPLNIAEYDVLLIYLSLFIYLS